MEEQRRGVAILAEQLAERELARMAEEEHRDMVRISALCTLRL